VADRSDVDVKLAGVASEGCEFFAVSFSRGAAITRQPSALYWRASSSALMPREAPMMRAVAWCCPLTLLTICYSYAYALFHPF
jgi:hypothetical protein